MVLKLWHDLYFFPIKTPTNIFSPFSKDCNIWDGQLGHENSTHQCNAMKMQDPPQLLKTNSHYFLPCSRKKLESQPQYKLETTAPVHLQLPVIHPEQNWQETRLNVLTTQPASQLFKTVKWQRNLSIQSFQVKFGFKFSFISWLCKATTKEEFK